MATWSSHGEKKVQRMKPSEILHAFSIAKANAARHATSSKIIEFVNVDDHTSRVSSTVPVHKPIFDPSPAEVWIDEYTPFHALVVKLSFRNCDTVARRMKIEPPQSPFFKIMPWMSSGKTGVSGISSKIDGKIAAGMDIAFQLEFSPHEIKEYAVDLVCCTERERFLVPVRVRGRYAGLDIPDEIHFGICPVKMPTSKVFTVHNVGTRGAKFAFKTSNNFHISPQSAVLEQGSGVQLELSMTPPLLSEKEGELTITDDSGQTAVVHLTGELTNVEVYLSQPLVEPNPTYISLSSRKTIKICNESEFTLEFCWKSFRDFAQEEVERDQILEELARMESAELEQLQLESDDGDEVNLPLQSSQSPFDVRKTIENKYKLLRKATIEDSMQFVDDCFTVAPLTGRVWPRSEVDVVICFSPMTALLYSCYAYLEVAGQEARLPLQIRGQGIGPRAKVVYNELLDFGDVFISDERTRDFTIQNKGEIPATFELLPVSMPSDMAISVSPNTGTLAVNTMCKVEVTFCSNRLGEVFTPIRFRLHGSEDQLTVRFKANVIPPVFHFDVDSIDFGAVSYSFPQTKTVKLISASKIAMKYTLRIPEEANYKKKEFEIIPTNGKLDAFGEQEVRINFTSLNVKVYEYRLVISVTGVGSDLLSIPIKGHCHVPEIVIQQPELDFGTCFLRYPHKQTLVLENKSPHLFGRFEIGEQDDHSKAIATYNASEFSGIIGPDEKVPVDIYLSCEKLGSIRLPMAITVPGSNELPLSATLTTVAAGPKVEIDQLEIHWGNCSCLVDHERVLEMTNTSLIPAPYKTFIRNARSKFQIDRKEGILAPGESVQFILTANLDDTILFKDQLHILITEGENLVVPLAMKGIGTTMWSPSELRLIDFSYQMTNVECEWSCTLENKGKRSQVLTWINKTAVAKLKLLDAGNSTTSKRSGPGQKNGANTKSSKSGDSSGNSRDGGPGAGRSANDDVIPVFSVFPASIELKPRTACVFVFKGLSAAPGHIQEELICETRVGKEKNNKVAFVTEICGDFINPKLTPSASLLAFEYVHHPGIEISRQSKPLSLTNVCELPLSFTLRTQTPFSLDCWEAILQPGEHVDFSVEFYPGFKDDHLGRVINGKIVITYTGHPQKDSVDLLGDISFPNLSFESSKIDFGCTLNDTQKAISVTVTNVSKVDTAFRWVFIEDEKEAHALATVKKPYIPINQVFDILPIRGHLKPSESERIEFIFYGHANRKFKSIVACEVEGGPEYELALSGEASSLVYKLDKQFLDFGQVLFNKTEDREFSILNVGKVPYGFNIISEKIGRGRLVEISPSSGKIAPNDKQKILVRLRPGIPEQFEETIVLEVAHFQPIKFKLFGVGVFASVNINLPRENHPSSTIQGENPKWRDLKKTARQNLELSTLNVAVVAVATANNSMSLASSDSRSTISTQPRVADRSSSTASMPPSPFGKSAQRSNGPHNPSRAHAHNKSSNNVGPQIDELDVEIEACRLFFAEYLLFEEIKKSESRALQKTELGQPQQLDVEELRTAEAPLMKVQRPESSSSASASGKSAKKRGPESFPFVLSQFVLDFGNVVLGTHKIKKFSITNIGHVPASFQLDKNFALSRGFQIEPERVVRLPEKHAVEFTVTFQARKSISLGIHQVQLPIVMKNGPPCILTIRAHVTIPDISISTETLDFGKMAVSTCHTMYTQIQNTSAVPAEWAVKKPMGSAKDLGNFRITPQTGVLAPGNKANIQVEFIPDDNRHFAIKLPIKVTSNSKTRSITCRGEGSELRLSFQPPMVELGPMLPCSGIAEHVVEMRNDSDYAVEVFSLDFDPVFKEDEELLRHLAMFNSDGLVNLPLRPPDQPLSEYLMENGLISADSLETREPSSTELSASTEEVYHGTDGEHDGDAAKSATPDSISSSAASLATVAQEGPVKTLVMKPRKAVDYIILGPPRCGKSTQAHLLAEKENLRVWSIDEAIRDVCVHELGSLGNATRLALGLVSGSGQEEIGSENTPSASDQDGAGGPASKDATELPESDDLQHSDSAEMTLAKSPSSGSLASLLDQILSWRLSQPDLQKGGVLDGFENAFVHFGSAVVACSKALASARVIVLNFDEECYEAMSNLLNDESLRSVKSTTVALVPLKESISNQLPYTGLAADMMQEESGSDESRHSESDRGDPETHPEGSVEQNSADEATVVPNSSEIHERLGAFIMTGALHGPKTFSEYSQALEANRQHVLDFLACDRESMHIQKHSSSSSLLITLTAEPEGSRHDTTAEQQQTGAKDWTRPDNFLLDIQINDPGAALLVHNMVYSVLEKHVRELESSQLAVPAAAKYQIIRRPTERFPRKPVTRFKIQSVTVRSVAKQSNQLEEAVEFGTADDNESLQVATAEEEPGSPASISRWVIPARSKVDLSVQFSSSDVGIFDCSLGFEIFGLRREFALFCRGVCTVPSINTDPRNVFMSRVKSRPESAFVQKKFVLSKNQFEFGPLIVFNGTTKVPETEQEFVHYAKTSPNNIEVFRMSNTSAFPLRVDFAMEKANDGAFAVFPLFLEIAEGETKEVRLWASPTGDGIYENNLICCVSDNPEPIAFSVSCFGCTPSLELRGPWEQPAAGSTSESEPSSPRDVAQPTRGSSPPCPVLDFEQLLLKRQEEKTFFVENVSPIAISWCLLYGDLPSDFRLFPMEGTIKPLQKAPVLVVFNANSEAIYKHQIQIQFSDAESALKVEERNRVLPLMIAAEAYKIDVSSFDKGSAGIESAASGGGTSANGDGSLDFGLVRVGESHSRSFNIRNRGKYNIKYLIGIRTHSSRDLFKVEPMEMVLEPGSVSSVSVTFHSKHEVSLRDCKDIKCTIIEMISGEPCREFTVFTTVRSVFSVFRVQPNRGINFGPHRYNDQVKTKRIEIRNDGEFPFKYRVQVSSLESGGGANLEGSLTLDTQLHPRTLSIGQFSISPDCGSVDPGVVVGLDVTFQPKDCKIYRELLHIEISGQNPFDTAGSSSDLLQYELVGESCFPGITTSDFESIFEEQIVVRSIGMEAPVSSASANTGGFGSMLGIQSVVFAEKEKIFSFGAMIAAANSKGAVERFKITNPTKVSTTVQFSISSHLSSGSGSSGGDPSGASPPQAFTVQPSVWEIPPLEHRFVSVYFKPMTIASYQATFAAKVDDSPTQTPVASQTLNDSTLLQFELRGEGTMPCVSVIEPTLRDPATGSLMLNFGRVRVSKAKDLHIVLRNDGILSATVLFSIQPNLNFFFPFGNGSVSIAPKATETLLLQFKPQKMHDEPTTSVLKIAVHNNPFDETTMKLSGTGYKEDLVFEDLPLGHDDELHFADIRLSNPAAIHDQDGNDDSQELHESSSLRADVKVFSLCNQSNETIRFAWPKTPPFVFTPAVGHLKPKAYKLIRATFAPGSLGAKAMIYDPQTVALQAQRIAYKDSAISQSSSDWDENARTVSFVAQQGSTQGSDEMLPEPVYDAIGAPSVVNLKCFAAADVLTFECDTEFINFKQTFMLQVCSHRISVRNKSKIKLEYSWRFERAFGIDSDGFLLPASVSNSDDDCPFEINPEAGSIAAEDTQIFTVNFAPMEVDEHHYMLVFSAESGQDDHEDDDKSSSSLRIKVRGSSLRPACHFDVDRSDYAQRRALHLLGPNGELGPLDPSVKVIEMESLGIRVRNTKRFYVVNPTNVSYEFMWTPEAETNPCFRCATPKGLMLAGKRCEMIFEFTPQQLELQEMFWRFQIPHFQVNQLFLFVGTTTEPRVILDRGSVNFNTLLIGTKALQSIALVNHEHIPFNFVFDKASLDFANEIPALLVHPLSGVIPPNSRSNIDIEFVPTEEKTYNLNLSCIIKRKPTRLSLNIKGEGYSIHDALTIASDDQDDARPVLLGAGNLLDFGAVRVNEELQRTVMIHNTGKFNFEFNWSAQKFPAAFAIEPMQGTVRKTDKVACKLAFAPLKQCSLDGTQLACTIAGSRNYVFALRGNAVPPSLQFSFMAHDFGPCFIGEPDALPISETVNLNIFNMDPEIGIDLDCMFEKKPHLRVDCPPTVLGPRESVNIPITFTARQETTYAEMIPFTVNGLSTISISIRGEGIVPKVELVNPSMQNVAFSALQIGHQVVRTIKIVNRAKRKISVNLVDGDVVISPGAPSLEMLSVSILSQREFELRPKETTDIEFKFAPTKRIPAFQKDVFIDIAGSKKKLVTLSGCCQGMEVSLDTDTLSFGTVCLGSQLVRKVRLQNRGDVAAKFQWNPRDFAPDFTVSPVEGMVAPNYHKTIEITFKPTVANPDLRYDHLACVIEGSSPPVHLTLVGGCVKQATSSIQELYFESRVRKSSTKQILIENKTDSPWNLFPVITGEHWSCQESVAVPAEGKTSVDIVYYPLRMTYQSASDSHSEGESDNADNSRPGQLEGSVFFAIPDGTALLYNVFGKATAPASAGTLSLSTPAKKTLPIAVTVKNWLKMAQTFDVTIKKLSAGESVLAQGPSSITVQGGATRNYNLKFFSYTEGAASLLVRFKNLYNGEYLDYDINVTVTKATEVETLHFEAPVRQSLKKIITIENPLDAQRVVSFVDKDNWWKCTSAAIRVRQVTEITGRPEGSYEVEYRPTLHSDTPVEAFLTISFAELGEYTYKLVLTTQQAGIERVLHFKAHLGGSQIQSFAFTTFSDKPAEMTCSVHETTFFSVPSSVRIDGSTGDWDEKSNVVQVKFEPEALGEVCDTLTLFAESVGEYKCTLQGVSVPPLPQGPFVFASTKDIEFRNVFSTPKEFEVMVDNPRFALSAKTLTIPAKSSKVVTVKVDHSAAGATAGTGGKPVHATPSLTAKLFVSCSSHKELPSWVYYLEAAQAST